jgi:hypothetical protein
LRTIRSLAKRLLLLCSMVSVAACSVDSIRGDTPSEPQPARPRTAVQPAPAAVTSPPSWRYRGRCAFNTGAVALDWRVWTMGAPGAEASKVRASVSAPAGSGEATAWGVREAPWAGGPLDGSVRVDLDSGAWVGVSVDRGELRVTGAVELAVPEVDHCEGR